MGSRSKNLIRMPERMDAGFFSKTRIVNAGFSDSKKKAKTVL
jgi:hypothetical protein